MSNTHPVVITDVAFKCYLRVALVTCWWLLTLHAVYLQARKNMTKASCSLT